MELLGMKCMNYLIHSVKATEYIPKPLFKNKGDNH